MYDTLKPELEKQLQEIKDAGLYKSERIITSPQGAEITTDQGAHVLNFCANNYLGLSSAPQVVEAAKRAIDTHGIVRAIANIGVRKELIVLVSWVWLLVRTL